MYTADEKQKIRNEIEYGQLKENELEDISLLIQEMHSDPPDSFFLRSHTPNYYHWMYYDNPAGKALVYRARHKGKLIGTFAMAPKRLKIGDEEVICGKTMDMFTHPDYQGLGIMSQLAKKVFYIASQDGLKMWYVTPSANSYPIFLKKWNYREEFEIAYLMKLLDARQLADSIFKKKNIGKIIGSGANILTNALHKIKPSLSHYNAEEVNHFGDETDALWQESKNDYYISLVRDSLYLNWRYIENPDTYKIFKYKRSGNLKGFLVLKHTVRRGMKIGEIVDFVSPKSDIETRKAMFFHGLDILRKDECVLAESWVINGSSLEKELKKYGLRIKKNKKIKFLLSPDSPFLQFYNSSNWLITQGDGNDI